MPTTNVTTNVTTGKPKVSGAVFRGATSLALPTTADAALASGFKALGYVSEDGVVNNNTPESDDIYAWGGDKVLSVQTSKSDEFTLTLIEALNANVLGTVYGDSNVTTGTGTITVNANSTEVPEQAFVIDMAMRGGALKRIVIPCGAIKEVGEITYKDDEAVGYEITIAAMPDASGNTHYEYIKTAAVST